MKTKIIIGILVFLLLIATISALYAWFRTPPVVNLTEYVEVPKIKVVTKIKEVKVPGPTEIITIEKQVLVQKIAGMPDWFKENADEQAIASAVIDSYRGKTNTVATLNTKTGIGKIIAKQEPLSLFGLLNEKEIGLRAGYGTKGIEGTIYGQWDFARVGNVHIGLYGEGTTGFEDSTTKSDAKVQVQIGYKF